MNDEIKPIRRPSQADLERVVGHFLYYLSNEPDDRTGVSPRMLFYGECPVQAKMLFPSISDETLHTAVSDVIALRQRQINVTFAGSGNWRSYS